MREVRAFIDGEHRGCTFPRSLSWFGWIGVLLLSGCGATRTSATQGERAACTRLTENLDYIHRSVQANLAVYHFDPEVRKRSDQAHQRERRLAARCRSELDYARGIRAYFASFHDPHIKPRVRFSPELRPAIAASLGHELFDSRLKPSYAATGILFRRIGAGYYVKRSIQRCIPKGR